MLSPLALDAIAVQLAAQSAALAMALDAGALTLSIAPPTAADRACIVCRAAAFDMSLADLMAVLRPAARDMGYGEANVRLRLVDGALEVTIPCEWTTPSTRGTVRYSTATWEPIP